MVKLRTSIKGLTHQERDAYIAAERHAQRLAIEWECAERCVAAPLGLADCSDLRVARSRMEWGRDKGRLCVRARVLVRPVEREHVFLWRVSLPCRVSRVSAPGPKKPVKNRV